jgi:hypothetical protein
MKVNLSFLQSKIEKTTDLSALLVKTRNTMNQDVGGTCKTKEELKKAHWSIGTESQMQEMPKNSVTHKAFGNVLKQGLKDPNAHDSEFVKAFKERAGGSLSRLERLGAATIMNKLATQQIQHQMLMQPPNAPPPPPQKN